MPLPKQGKKKRNFFLVIVALALPKMGGAKKIEWNCGNVIAENGRKKKMLLPKSREEFKKKKGVTFTIFL